MASNGSIADPAPPYEASVRSLSTAISTSTAPTSVTSSTDSKLGAPGFHPSSYPAAAAAPAPPTISAALTAARADRVAALCATYIEPALHASAAEGMGRTTLVLIPTPESAGSADESAAAVSEEVVGLAADPPPVVVRLTDPAHGVRFWTAAGQGVAVRELEATLRARLVAAGHKVYDASRNGKEQTDSTKPERVMESVPPSRPTPPEQKRTGSFFAPWRSAGGAEGKKGGQKPVKTPVPAAAVALTKPRDLEPGELWVGVKLRDVAFRVETHMGLYDTRSGKVVVVTVRIGNRKW